MLIENSEQYAKAVAIRELLSNEIKERRVITNLKSKALRELDKDIQLWRARKSVKDVSNEMART